MSPPVNGLHSVDATPANSMRNPSDSGPTPSCGATTGAMIDGRVMAIETSVWTSVVTASTSGRRCE